MLGGKLSDLFFLDPLAVVLIGLVGFIGLIVGAFSRKYLQGDTQAGKFRLLIGLLFVSLTAMVTLNQVFLVGLAWLCSNLILVRLMVHKSSWRAARASGMLALKNFALGFALVMGAFALLYQATGETSVSGLISSQLAGPLATPALLLLLLGAMTQSAIWPFHRWLVSSLNSPTPVSAMMHAGLVNGGGFLLVRFAPLYLQHPSVMLVIFGVGMLTAVIGTLWKLMQHDVKRMLACSTMGQMGFMIAQCGLGLFPAAVTHLCWHGVYKAYLFLGVGNTAREKRFDRQVAPKGVGLTLALGCGLLGSWVFAQVTHQAWLAADTSLVMVAVAFMASSQLALSLLHRRPIKMLPVALLASVASGGLYGLNIRLVESFLAPLNLMQPQPLNAIYISGLVALFATWSLMILARSAGRRKLPAWSERFYVKLMNDSQPHPSTVTAHRNHYKYV